jgi:hypothetical protein
MALTVTSTINQANRTFRVDAGLTFAQRDIATSTGSAGADYSSGFDLVAIAQQLGFNVIFTVFDALVQNKPQLRGTWDIKVPGTNKLRFYIPAGTEVTTEIAANDIIRCFIAGI